MTSRNYFVIARWRPCLSDYLIVSAESPEAGAGAGAEDIEASIQEKLHKSEVARLRKAFSEQRNNTLSLFQFFLTSEYSQLVKLMELSECHLVRKFLINYRLRLLSPISLI